MERVRKLGPYSCLTASESRNDHVSKNLQETLGKLNLEQIKKQRLDLFIVVVLSVQKVVKPLCKDELTAGLYLSTASRMQVFAKF